MQRLARLLEHEKTADIIAKHGKYAEMVGLEETPTGLKDSSESIPRLRVIHYVPHPLRKIQQTLHNLCQSDC